MSALVMGVDFGSTTGKAIILDEAGAIVGAAVSAQGAVSDDGVKEAMAQALEQAGIELREIVRAVSTGYGRRMLDVADRTITEITCHARGAVEMVPDARLVIDIGGQDSKVIAIDADGFVERFQMNDRCAAGTGKFLETLARALDVELGEMGPLALQATQDLMISSMCATFAETEVIGLLAEGASKIDVLGGVHGAVAKRTVGMVSRVGRREPVVMTGGVARNVAIVRRLEEALGTELILPERPQLAGALGAALFALDDFRQEGASRRHADLAVERDLEAASRAMLNCVPACAAKTATALAISRQH